MPPDWQAIALTVPGSPEPSLAIAASRAGALGILDLEYATDPGEARAALADLARFGRQARGVKLDLGADDIVATVLDGLPAEISTVLIARPALPRLADQVGRLRSLGKTVLVEATDAATALAAAEAGAAGVVLKGNEAGGRVGEETAFVLLQRCVRAVTTSLWVQGGIGPDTAAACIAGGAAGVVLDWQLALTRESHLATSVKARLASFDGSETVVVGGGRIDPVRVYGRPGSPALEAVRAAACSGSTELLTPAQWRETLARLASHEAPDPLLLLSQDAAFAASLAARYQTVGGVVEALAEGIPTRIQAAQRAQPLAEGGPLAASVGTRYPILQGPMTRVSDVAAFCLAVGEAGALPFLALALLRAPEVEVLLRETQTLLGERPWGVGILGFVPLELRQEQLEVVRRYRSPFAIIAGGRPDQAAALEADGITTYLHVPSPGLLELFLQQGARRFVFEGRECGGHVGPRSSFVLWQSMINLLLAKLESGKLDGPDCQVVFAGGIHDARSAAMVTAMAGALAARGVKVGVLMGTAYLFTEEAVACEAITSEFQRQALACNHTVLLETGPGHAIRCADTPYRTVFERRRDELLATQVSREEARLSLEELNLGRLRLASKGIERNPRAASSPAEPRYLRVSASQQRAEGMYMIGQIAALRDSVTTIAELHQDVSAGGTHFLASVELELPAARSTAPTRPSDVAIVGMSTLLPKARSLAEYWENIVQKVDAIEEVPPDRWDPNDYFDPDPTRRDRVYSAWGGFLDDVPFDPLTYGMPPNTLGSIEPLQLLTLEAVWAALADAGYGERPFDRERTAVVLGAGGGAADLGQLYAFRSSLPKFFGQQADAIVEQLDGALPEWTEDSFAGILLNVAAGRVANRFDLGGSNFTVDAACASSLAAAYLGVRELETGAANLVVVGGVDTMQNAFAYLCFSKTRALSPRGRCRTFDDTADGIVISEGLVMLVLKRLEDAERDGDRIYAVIKGVGSSSDGRDRGLTAPRPEGQIRALERAYAKAGISPATVGLIEAHGTGTVAGDRAEVEALTRFFAGAGAARQRCAIGSVKSMIGHTKCTAGVAGLAKAALALHHKVLPPTLGVEKPNSRASFPETPFYVNSETRPWIRPADDTPRRAGVSAFGFGGTNFHVVLEEYDGAFRPPLEAPRRGWTSELFVWQATDRTELLGEIERLQQALAGGATPSLAELAFTLSTEADPQAAERDVRLAIAARSLDDLQEKLETARRALLDDDRDALADPRGIFFSARPAIKSEEIAFLFPGQGSQYPNMGLELALQFSEVRAVHERADAYLVNRYARPLSSWVFPPPTFSEQAAATNRCGLTDTHVAQPALGAAAVAGAALLRSLGVEPAMVAGHSYGEFVALWAAGVFSEETLFQLSEARGRFMRESTEQEAGTMAAVDTDASTVAAILNDLSDVACANFNAPRQTVISGTNAAVEQAIAAFAARGIRARPLPVACAFHSPLVASAQGRLAEVLAEIPFDRPKLPVYSNTLGAAYGTEPTEIARLLAEHLARPVEFVRQIEAMHADGARVFVEVGPRAVLSGLVGQILEGRPHLAVAIDQEGRAGLATLVLALGRLWAAGVPVATGRLFQGRGLQRLDRDRLEQSNAGPELSPTTWLVNGARAIPARDRDKPTPLPRVTLTNSPGTSAGSSAGSSNAEEEANLIPEQPYSNGAASLDLNAAVSPPAEPTLPLRPPAAGSAGAASPPLPSQPPLVSGDTAAVLGQFQQVMTRFLETQQAVMLAYLGAARQQPVASPLLRSHPVLAAGPIQTTEAVLPPAVVTPALNSAPIAAPPAVELAPTPAAPAAETIVSGPVLPSPAAPAVTRESLTASLLAVVVERTGYPIEMLDLDLDLEADLGIDSIKRVEILGTFRQQTGDTGSYDEAEMEQLASKKTLRGIVEWVLEHTAAGSVDPAAGVAAAAAPTAGPVATPAADEPIPLADSGIGRSLTKLVDAPLAGPSRGLTTDGALVITDDGRGLATALAARLRAAGQEVALLRLAADVAESEPGIFRSPLTEAASEALAAAVKHRYGAVRGLVHLLPLRPPAAPDERDPALWRQRLAEDLEALFYLARAFGPELHAAAARGGATLIAASSLGGDLGSSGDPVGFAGTGGVVGLTKTLALEWPEVRVRAVDLDLRDDVEVLADYLVAELASDDREVEVGYRGGRRQALRLEPAPLEAAAPEQLTIGPDWVVLLTGGARGITARAALELARRYRPTLLLAGSSPRPADEEDPETRPLERPQEIRSTLLDRARRAGRTVTPAEIEREYRALARAREIRATMSAIAAAGASVEYFQVDLRESEAVRELIEQVYDRYGRLDGVIHGAGIIEDKLVEQKEPSSFRRVLSTKADSAYYLSRLLHWQELRFLVFFSSASGRFGNRGQGDYAAANEILNKLAQQLDRTHRARVVAINWGPWATGGMVSPELERTFAERGIRLIPPDVGARMLDQELRWGAKGQAEVLVAGGTWQGREPARPELSIGLLGPALLTTLEEAGSTPTWTDDGQLVATVRLSPEVDLYLQDHVLDDTPVLPTAMAQELLAELIQFGWPRWHLGRLTDLQVLRGVVFDTPARAVELVARAVGSRGDLTTVQAELRTGSGAAQLHFRLTAELGPPPPAAEPATVSELVNPAPFLLTVKEAYERWLFHGERLAHIEDLATVADNGLEAWIRPSDPSTVIGRSVLGDWLVDPVVFDCALQMLLLWQRYRWDTTGLPARYTALHRFSAPGSRRIRCRLVVAPGSTAALIRGALAFWDEAGNLVWLLEEMECAASKALNRLTTAVL